MRSAVDFVKSGQRAIDWLCRRIDASGSFGEESETFFAYYKAPLAYATAGRVIEAERAIHFIAGKFFPGGRFREGEVYRAATTSPAYRLAWLALGANAVGAHDLAVRLVDLLLEGQDPATGAIGYCTGEGGELDELTAGTTSAGVTALIALGRIEPAIRGGRFIARLFADQPVGTDTLVLRRDPAGPLAARPASTKPVSWCIALAEPGQIYWCLGYALTVFGKLYMVTRDSEWLDHAQGVYDWISRCHPNVFANITSGKIAWGGSVVYHASRQIQYAELAERVGRWFLDVQTADGAWVRLPQYTSLAEQPMPVSLDTTLERSFFMHEIAKAMAIA